MIRTAQTFASWHSKLDLSTKTPTRIGAIAIAVMLGGAYCGVLLHPSRVP